MKAAGLSTLLAVGAELATSDEDRLIRAIRAGAQDTVNQAGQQIVHPPHLYRRASVQQAGQVEGVEARSGGYHRPGAALDRPGTVNDRHGDQGVRPPTRLPVRRSKRRADSRRHWSCSSSPRPHRTSQDRRACRAGPAHRRNGQCRGRLQAQAPAQQQPQHRGGSAQVQGWSVCRRGLARAWVTGSEGNERRKQSCGASLRFGSGARGGDDGRSARA